MTVNGSLIVDDNLFESFTAPNLTKSGGFVFVGNPNLKNISLPQLTQIGGGFQIANNSKLLNIDGFKNLKTVDGAIDFSGNFTK